MIFYVILINKINWKQLKSNLTILFIIKKALLGISYNMFVTFILVVAVVEFVQLTWWVVCPLTPSIHLVVISVAYVTGRTVSVLWSWPITTPGFGLHSTIGRRIVAKMDINTTAIIERCANDFIFEICLLSDAMWWGSY